MLEGAAAARRRELRIDGQYALAGVYAGPCQDWRGPGLGEAFRQLRAMGDPEGAPGTDRSELDGAIAQRLPEHGSVRETCNFAATPGAPRPSGAPIVPPTSRSPNVTTP